AKRTARTFSPPAAINAGKGGKGTRVALSEKLVISAKRGVSVRGRGSVAVDFAAHFVSRQRDRVQAVVLRVFVHRRSCIGAESRRQLANGVAVPDDQDGLAAGAHIRNQ